MNRLISGEKSVELFNKIKEAGKDYFYDYQKHRIVVEEKAATGATYEPLHLRLPITVPPLTPEGNIKDGAVNYIILLIQSGSSALGYFEGHINYDHKVYKSYMVRRKQGKSQIKYLNTRGKSKAGSRVRLSNTLDFFENINERLQEYFNDNEIHRIAISCSKTLIPYLFNSKVECPFDKKDERIYKIPKHIHTPGYEHLMECQKFLMKGELIYEDKFQPLVNALLQDYPELDED